MAKKLPVSVIQKSIVDQLEASREIFAGLDDPALTAIAEIVHDIDLKDGKFGREEASGIKMLIAGICADTRDDNQRLVRGAAIFDDLYAVFRRKRSGARAAR